MASFARSFKPPSYLSPRRRPAMPGRTISNSSELSLASNHSGRSEDAPVDTATSVPGTPNPFAAAAEDGTNETISPSSRSNSRPIAIELPKITKLNTSSVRTPPEPLSARGDLPGGYFPLHEDPKGRIHRPHPFQKDANKARTLSLNLASESMPNSSENSASKSAIPSIMTQSNTPVDSYFPTGYHDHSLSMGKYYPSNYEHRHGKQKNFSHRPTLGDSIAASTTSESRLPSAGAGQNSLSPKDAESRRRMQQYQRDMVAQASMALGTTSRAAAKAHMSVGSLNLKDGQFASAMLHKPTSPKLAPMGSPGPVTPMELEGSGGGYLDQGIGQNRRGYPPHPT